MSKELGELVVRYCKAEDFQDCDIVFSGLDSDVAGDVGTKMEPRHDYIGRRIVFTKLHRNGFPQG